MKRFYFFIVFYGFLALFCKAQNEVSIEFCGEIDYEVENNEIVLRWDNTCRNALYYQIFLHDFTGIHFLFATVSGDESSYVMPMSYHYYMMTDGTCHILAFYDDGEVGKSQDIYPPDISSHKILKNFNYSFQEWGSVNISWEARGILPLYYEIECNGFQQGIPGDNYTIGIPEYYFPHFLNPVCIHVVYEDEAFWIDSVVVPNPDIASDNFNYEVHSENHLTFDWEPYECWGCYPYQIESNGEIISGDIWEAFFDCYYLGTGKLHSYYDYEKPFPLHIGKLHNFSLYMNHSNERIKAKNDTFYFVKYAVPFNLEYSIGTNDVHLNWQMQEGEQPIFLQITRNGEEIDRLTPDNTSFIDYVPIGRFTYVLLAVFEDNEEIVANNIVNVVVSPAALKSFTAQVTDINNVFLSWEVSPNGIQPQYFQLVRNGIVVDSIAAGERTYLDTNLEAGTSTYDIILLYENGTVQHVSDSLEVTIEYLDYALPVNFRCAITNMDVLLFWNIIQGNEMPTSFQIKRDGNIIWETQDSLVCSYIDANLVPGIYTYRLSAFYANGMVANLDNEFKVMVLETSNEIVVGEGMKLVIALLDSGSYYLDSITFSHVVMGNNVNLSWTIAQEAIQPVSFQIERNGEFLVNLSGDQRSYQDLGLEVGTYVYTFRAFCFSDVIACLIKYLIGTVRDCE